MIQLEHLGLALVIAGPKRCAAPGFFFYRKNLTHAGKRFRVGRVLLRLPKSCGASATRHLKKAESAFYFHAFLTYEDSLEPICVSCYCEETRYFRSVKEVPISHLFQRDTVHPIT